MPFIWNNKKYMLVNDDTEWDKLEFIVARKLHVEYNSEQPLSIAFVKKSFETYGRIEKIEIFGNKYNNSQFTHVTFKDDRTAYLALIDMKQKDDSKIQIIRPADAHEQPDNPIDSSKSPFYNLPDKCLMLIFEYCDIHTIGAMSVVCKKMCELLRSQFFKNKFTMEASTNGETEVSDTLVTVSRIVQCIDPIAFELKIYRDLTKNIEWPTISVDFVSFKKSTLFVEATFFNTLWLRQLEIIIKRIKRIYIKYSIYDLAEVNKIPICDIIWPNVKTLIIGGYQSTNSISEFTLPISSLPKLETLLIRDLHFRWGVENLYCRAANLRNIHLENCLLEQEISYEQIQMVAEAVKQRKNHSYLCMKFYRIRIQAHCRNSYKKCTIEDHYNEVEQQQLRVLLHTENNTYCCPKNILISPIPEDDLINYMISKDMDINFQQALKNEDVKKYIRFDINGDPCSE